MSIYYERTFQGAWRLSAMVNGYDLSRQYFGYTKTEATKLFRAEARELKARAN